jgi:hypothetical protein
VIQFFSCERFKLIDKSKKLSGPAIDKAEYLKQTAHPLKMLRQFSGFLIKG